MTRKGRRLALIGAAGAVLALAVALVLMSLGSSMSYFASPSDIAGKQMSPTQRWRLGGLVENGTVVRGQDSQLSFSVTDTNASVKVTYSGVVPDLFREGQGVVVEGTIDGSGVFRADTLLAKHDEKYMPREVADALKAQGHWLEDGSYGKKP